MKPSFFAPFALLPVLALAGCGAPPAQNSANEVGADAPEPLPTATPAPTATPKPEFPEDERYRSSGVEEQQFGPDATPKEINAYKTAMSNARQDRPPLAMKVPDKARVVLQTNRGPITLELDGKAAPLHVKSFIYLSGRGFYNGTIFHRHSDLMGGGKGFIVQGGDPLTKDANTVGLAGIGGPGYTVPREKNKLTHKKLVIAAARTNDPDSAGSQFYITQDDTAFLDEGDGYTVFGKVVAGQAAAMKLTKGDTLQSVKIEQGNTNLKSAKTGTSSMPQS